MSSPASMRIEAQRAAGDPAPGAAERTLTAQFMHLVHDLKAHRPRVYWADFLATIGLFWGAFAALLARGAADAAAVGLFAVAVLALYRASCFMHEIVHLPRAALPGFRWTQRRDHANVSGE